MTGGLVITATTSTRGARVRVDGCPRCHRQLRLDYAGVVRDGEPFVDLDEVMFAQRLHLATCAG